MILTSSMAVHVRTIKSQSSMGFGKASAGYIRSSLFWINRFYRNQGGSTVLHGMTVAKDSDVK